ncbi:MAG: rhamnogalacturonan acetylesterase [Verrucomicrobiota bacterium]
MNKTKACLRYGMFICLAVMLSPPSLAADERGARIRIALVGDSTVCNYPETASQRGWGQLLPEFLADGVVVDNLARGGASTKTFPAKRWQRALEMKPDYVLIQFGHNDSHAADRPEATDAATDYRDNLRRFVTEARAVGARPVLVTPVRRRLFKNGEPTIELRPYAEAMRAVAVEMDVPLIDLYTDSGKLYAQLGEAGSEAYTMNHIDLADRPGNGDRTHFTETGAREMARLVAIDFAAIDARAVKADLKH